MLCTHSSWAKGRGCFWKWEHWPSEQCPGLYNIALSGDSSWPLPLPIAVPSLTPTMAAFSCHSLKHWPVLLTRLQSGHNVPDNVKAYPRNPTVSWLISTSVPRIFPWMSFQSLSKTKIHREVLPLFPVAGPVLLPALFLSSCMSQSCSPEQRTKGMKGHLKKEMVRFSENSPTWRKYQNSFSPALTV